ncbi:MAG: DNA repair protein RecN, partial [Pseudomonadota bacterium]
SVRNLFLIDALNVTFKPGLNVLTGETGAGKSVLLSCLGLVFGARTDRTVLRDPDAAGQATADLVLRHCHPVFQYIADHGFDEGDVIDGTSRLLLRRRITPDGRSRAFLNDNPISLSLLRAVGDLVLEVHGQHEDRGLMSTATQRDLLDDFGSFDADLSATRQAFTALEAARERLAAVDVDEDVAEEERRDLAEVLETLHALDPQADEEESLSAERKLLQNAEQIISDLSDVSALLAADNSLETRLARAATRLASASAAVGGALSGLVDQVEKVLIEAEEARRQVSDLLARLDYDSDRLGALEERLFTLRDLARRYRVPVADLPGLAPRLEARLTEIDRLATNRQAALAETERAEKAYLAAAATLSSARMQAARRLDDVVAEELPPLKLDKARFETRVEAGAAALGPKGTDTVHFLIATNPGDRPDRLMKIASGGELSRILLAIKVALADAGSPASLVFDEVDRGVGGAVADAVGSRLSRLAASHQVLVVTHAPQVAACADHHFQIAKSVVKNLQSDDQQAQERAVTRVKALDEPARRDEVARMLAGAVVTPEARAAADRLIALGQRSASPVVEELDHGQA